MRLNPTGARTVGPTRRIPESSGAPAISDTPDHDTRRIRTRWAWARLGVGALVLGVLVARLGAGPFLDGLRLSSAWSLLAATAVTGVTTWCCAWRWRLVAGGLGVRLGASAAFAAVYRSQLLNATLPGGVLGDVDRALIHARDTGVVGPGVRSVVWERTLGQVVQVTLTVAVLLVLPSPLRGIGLTVAGVATAALLLALLLGSTLIDRARAVRATLGDLRTVLGTPRDALALTVLSLVAVTGHVLVFLLAARVAGVHAQATELLPLAAVVLLAAAVPANVAGWGPREGVAAWAFATAGLGAGTGLTTAVVYGVMALVATLPGAVVLLAGGRSWFRPAFRRRVAVLEEAVHG